LSIQIKSFSVAPVQGGLKAEFIGFAIVKMGGADFTSGWKFDVVAFDFSRGSDFIGITLITRRDKYSVQQIRLH
jgi:hypothetical protein